MDALKKFFPFSFGAKDVAAFIIKIIIYLVAGAIIGVVLSLVGKIPVVGIITGIIGTIAEIYILCGIVLTVLDYLKILK
ncbi:MAG: hypothetical protein IJB65_02160 [Clostridia bacterium]|nr:hypothetical protein [Clostridia bacterium]